MSFNICFIGNSPPRFNVTAPSVTFAEDTAGGTSLYTIWAYDVDGVSPSLTFTYDQLDTYSMFQITGRYEIPIFGYLN